MPRRNSWTAGRNASSTPRPSKKFSKNKPRPLYCRKNTKPSVSSHANLHFHGDRATSKRRVFFILAWPQTRLLSGGSCNQVTGPNPSKSTKPRHLKKPRLNFPLSFQLTRNTPRRHANHSSPRLFRIKLTGVPEGHYLLFEDDVFAKNSNLILERPVSCHDHSKTASTRTS